MQAVYRYGRRSHFERPDVPSACACVMSTASIFRSPYLGNHSTAACWKLFPTSITIVLQARKCRQNAVAREVKRGKARGLLTRAPRSARGP